MKLSVALGTFNGVRFLPLQLASIQNQTRPPDELIVCDDASTDDTILLVREFARRASFPVRVDVSFRNRGSAGNFDRAIRLCTGDAIALADQDDDWQPGKLAALESALRAEPSAGMVFSNADVVDEWGRPLKHTLWEAIDFGHREQARFQAGEAFAGLLRRNRITGATLAFRASFRELISPIPANWVHDAWIALLIAAVSPCVLISESLVRYRRHNTQQIGDRRPGLLARYREAKRMTQADHENAANRYEQVAHRLAGCDRLPVRNRELLAAKVAHLRQRAALREPGSRRFSMIGREFLQGNYRRYSHGWKAIAQDIFLS